jgi:hypothetical protein
MVTVGIAKLDAKKKRVPPFTVVSALTHRSKVNSLLGVKLLAWSTSSKLTTLAAAPAVVAAHAAASDPQEGGASVFFASMGCAAFKGDGDAIGSAPPLSVV